MVRATLKHTGNVQATLLLIRFDSKQNVITTSVLEKIRLGLKHIGSPHKSLEVMSGTQKGLWGLFENVIAVSWIANEVDEVAQQDVDTDLALVLNSLKPLLGKFLLNVENATNYVVHQGMIPGGEQAIEGWRLLFAEALRDTPLKSVA